jgi:hypothetical protein
VHDLAQPKAPKRPVPKKETLSTSSAKAATNWLANADVDLIALNAPLCEQKGPGDATTKSKASMNTQ